MMASAFMTGLHSQQLRHKTGSTYQGDLRPGKIVQSLNPPDIDEIDMGTIQMHGFPLLEIQAALTIQKSDPLIRDFSLELDEHVAPAFLHFCHFEHDLHRSCVFV